jgi:hypothetical protein
MTRTDIINEFIRKRGYSNYLEIGIFVGENFSRIKAPVKVGVDPAPMYDPKNGEILLKVTSDDFFNSRPNYAFDIVFIDGLHEAEQVYRDVMNSFDILNQGGVILLHDCNPPTEKHARPEYTSDMAEWNGDVYKAWIKLRSLVAPWAYVIDTDWGVGVIDTTEKPKEILPTPWSSAPEKWEEFDKNRKVILNLISPNDFLNRLNAS